MRCHAADKSPRRAELFRATFDYRAPLRSLLKSTDFNLLGAPGYGHIEVRRRSSPGTEPRAEFSRLLQTASFATFHDDPAINRFR